jgi:hypothetical protein
MNILKKHLAPKGAVYDYGKYAGAGFENTSPENFKIMTDRELDLYFEQLGVEMRPAADLIVKLRAGYEKMPRGKEKYARHKTIKNLEDDFCAAFNRFDCFDQFVWPDGLTVNFIGPSSVTLKDGRQKLRRTPPTASFSVRPVFSRREP